MKKIPSRILRKRLVSKNDSLFSLAVRLRAKKSFGGMCPFCHMLPVNCCFHFIHRGKFSVRWDFNNAIGACFKCNFKMERWPESFITYYINNNGLANWEKLVKKSNQIAKFSLEDLEQINKSLRAELEKGDTK